MANVEPYPKHREETPGQASVEACGGRRGSIARGLNGAGHVDIGFYLFPEHLEW